jgi:alcohol dehydrogenase
MDFEFNLRTNLKVGVGTALKLGGFLEEIDSKTPAVIIDSALKNKEYIKDIIVGVEKKYAGKVKTWYYDLKSEPDYKSLDRVKMEFLDYDGKSKVDCFVGIGGGSVIDFTKGLATLVVNHGDAISYRGFPKDINPSLPIIAIPTTAGTASEVTYNAVFIDTDENKKLGINTLNNFPVLAVLDPNLVAGAPKAVAVSSGMDALTHAMESYVATKANMITKIFARESFKLIFNNLSRLMDDYENIEIWENMQIGAYLAGISLMNSGSGPAGALSYILGAKFKVPHGIAGAVFLPYIVNFNCENGYDYSELYDLVENVDKSKTKEEKNKEFSKMFFELCDKIGVPKKLDGFGVSKKNINILLDEIGSLKKAFEQNSIPFLVEDGKKLLNKLTK